MNSELGWMKWSCRGLHCGTAPTFAWSEWGHYEASRCVGRPLECEETEDRGWLVVTAASYLGGPRFWSLLGSRFPEGFIQLLPTDSGTDHQTSWL